jgi:hypothetical protein
VRSGQALRHGLLVRNLIPQELTIATNGQVTAVMVDPRTGQVAGGFAGFQTLAGIYFQAAAGVTERIPLLIGTASSVPDLGYTIPPGSWGIQIPLDLQPDLHTREPRLTSIPGAVIQLRPGLLPVSADGRDLGRRQQIPCQASSGSQPARAGLPEFSQETPRSRGWRRRRFPDSS